MISLADKEEVTVGATSAFAGIENPSIRCIEGERTEGVECSGWRAGENTAVVLQPLQNEIHGAQLGCMLGDGVLSSNGLANMGMSLTYESSREEASAFAGSVNPSTHCIEGGRTEEIECSGWRAEESTAVVVQPPQDEIHDAVLGGLLRDGVFSSNSLAKMGMILTDESSREEACAFAGRVNPSTRYVEVGRTEEIDCSGWWAEESTAVVFQPPQEEIHNAEHGGFLRDGVLSSNGLAKMGVILTNESSREEASAFAGSLNPSTNCIEEGTTEDTKCSGWRSEKSTAVFVQRPHNEMHEAELGGLLMDGVLSSDGSAKMNMVVTCESSSEEASAFAGSVSRSTHCTEEGRTEDRESSGWRAEESTAIAIVQPPQYEVHVDELGGLLKDGVLSSNGLAKLGMVLTDENSSEEESESSAEKDDSESDDSSDEYSSSEEDEEIMIIKEKIRSCDETKEDTEPPRTKNEVSVLPPVPKVEAVLESRHVCISIGVISSVVDRYIVVEGSEDSRVVNDGSVLWLTESRVPLGIVDEVFGPVKKPYYSLRFNEASDIHEFAKVGADVAYVDEFAEFVLKDNPSLYKKAIDASGLDDEELSDAEIEFSDDEKEMAAKQRERGKRGYDGKENGGQTLDSSESQPPENKGRRQRRERGRGRGYNRGGGHRVTEGVDLAMADMDLHGSGFSAGSLNHRARVRPVEGRSQFQSNSFQSGSGVWDRQDLGATYSRRHDGLNRGDWVASPTRHSPNAGPSANGAHHQGPMLRRDERRDGPWFSEQVADLGDRQPHQAVGIQGIPSFGVSQLPRHLQGPGAEPRQQVGSGYPTFGYNSIAAPQIATDGQGNFFHITGPVNLPPDVGNVGRMGINVGPTVMSVLPPASPNPYPVYNNPVQGSLNVRQGGYDPVYQADIDHRGQHGNFMAPSPVYNSRIAAPEFRFQAMASNSALPGPRSSGVPQRSGYARGSRYQGPRGR